MDCRELVNKCTGDRRCPVESFQQRALADFSPSTPAVLQVFSRRAVGPAIILRPAAVLLSCCEIHTLAMRSSRIFAKHAPAASGILKPRSRPDNFSATCCRAAEKSRSRRRPQRALSVFSLCLLVWHIFPWRRHLVHFFSAAAAQVTANWLKPLKFPECAARTRRVGQLELSSHDRSCLNHAVS